LITEERGMTKAERGAGVKRKERRVEEAEAAEKREKQIWVTGPVGTTVCDGLAEAALYLTNEAGIPIAGWQVEAALRVGFALCGMVVSYTKPEIKREKRPPLLRRDQLEEGIIRVH
jgi:hypothetical protein